MKNYPYMDMALQQLERTHKILADGVLHLAESGSSQGYLTQGDEVVRTLMTKSGDSQEALQKAVASYCQVCLDFMKHQGRFNKTGKYHQEDVKKLISDIYENEEMMNHYYLDGLLLTFAFWHNHQALLRFFTDRFLVRVDDAEELTEVGVGHGLFFLKAAQALKSACLTGIDVSPYSLAYTDSMMKAHGQSPERYRLEKRDVFTDGLAGSAQADAIVCGEVLEHVPDPVALARRLAEACKPDGYMFLTTCANTEAVDHIFLFHDVAHIHRTLEEAGLVVFDEIVLPVQGMERDVPMPLNYACVAGRAG